MTIFVVTVMSLLVWIYAESRTAKPAVDPSDLKLPIDSPMQTLELAPVPVVLSVRPEDAQRFSFSIDESDKLQSGLTLSGPPWLVEQVLPLRQAVRAYVEVTPELIAEAKDDRVLVEPVIRRAPNGLIVKGIQPVWVTVKPIK